MREKVSLSDSLRWLDWSIRASIHQEREGRCCNARQNATTKFHSTLSNALERSIFTTMKSFFFFSYHVFYNLMRGDVVMYISTRNKRHLKRKGDRRNERLKSNCKNFGNNFTSNIAKIYRPKLIHSRWLFGFSNQNNKSIIRDLSRKPFFRKCCMTTMILILVIFQKHL